MAAPVKSGQRFGGFKVLREVDQDGLGTLYEVEHPRLHRKVALRAIGPAAARDVSHSRRFLLELRSYVALEHPAIPRLYELAYDGDCPYLVTEIIPGKTLDDVLTDGAEHDPLGVIELLEPIASARLRARPRDHPPRRQALEHPPRRRRPDDAHGLRPRHDRVVQQRTGYGGDDGAGLCRA